MIPLLAIAVATIVACEVALRSPLIRMLSTLTGSARKAGSVVRSDRISDHWKEKVLLTYALRIMGASLGLLLCLIAIAIPVVLAASVVEGSLAAGSALLLRPLPLVLMIAVGVVWIWGRRRLTA